MQLPLGIRLKDGNTFGNFISGPNSEVLAYLHEQLCDGVAVYLWGVAGTGKTHLLQAACHEAVKADLRSAYVPLTCWRELSVELLQGLEAVDLVCIDDVAAIAGQAEWEAALFHLYNRLRDVGGRLLISGTLPPVSLPLALPDLRSRLAWGMVFQLQALDDEEKLAGLRQRARARGLDLPEKVGRYLLQRCPRDMTSLFRLLDSLDRASLAAQRRLTIPFIKEVMDAQYR